MKKLLQLSFIRLTRKAFMTKGFRHMKMLPFVVITLFVLTACGGLKMGAGYLGEMIDENRVTLDGDTFSIRGKVGEDMLIVMDEEHIEDAKPCYLLKRKRNGRYYPQLRATDMSSIDNTADFIRVDGCDVYDLRNKRVLFTSPCAPCDLIYIGKWKDKQLFSTLDTICFSDGRCLGLRKNVYGEASKEKGMLTLVDGAQRIKVSFAELYDATNTKHLVRDATVERLTRDYDIKPRNDSDNVEAGIHVDLDVPKGNAKADKAIRQWMMGAMAEDAFSLLGMDIPAANGRTLDELKSSVDGYGILWEKLCRANYLGDEPTWLWLTCDIKVDKVADCDDCVTYHYWASLYNGGLHEMPHSYYITYDKRRDCLLDLKNSVKPGSVHAFRKEVLKSMKPQYDEVYERLSSWDEFTYAIFSFHCPAIDTNGMDEAIKSMLEHNYACDGWAGWNGCNEEPFTEQNFPLTHLAVLPEGIVLTYHPYQVDCFAAGEYHAVVPFKDAAPYLKFDYSNHEDLKPRLGRFVK